MPLIQSTYKSPFWLFNAHAATILPSLFRKVEGVHYKRERISTPDNDFMDLDWLENDSDNLLLLSHGLEGSSNRHYMKGPALYFSERGWDVVAWNCRSCSGEINRQPRMYHHAATDDLETVIRHIINKNKYKQVVLAGFSMGGNLILKYLGENGNEIPKQITKAITFSVPCNLGDSADRLSKNLAFYRKRFLAKLKMKMKKKSHLFPHIIAVDGLDEINEFRAFDERYTAPLHGFRNADHFYASGSASQYLSGITIPALIVNALNDPFFPDSCYPFNIAKNLANVYLETPKKGGHVGFMLSKSENWMEKRIWQFIHEQ